MSIKKGCIQISRSPGIRRVFVFTVILTLLIGLIAPGLGGEVFAAPGADPMSKWESSTMPVGCVELDAAGIVTGTGDFTDSSLEYVWWDPVAEELWVFAELGDLTSNGNWTDAAYDPDDGDSQTLAKLRNPAFYDGSTDRVEERYHSIVNGAGADDGQFVLWSFPCPQEALKNSFDVIIPLGEHPISGHVSISLEGFSATNVYDYEVEYQNLESGGSSVVETGSLPVDTTGTVQLSIPYTTDPAIVPPGLGINAGDYEYYGVSFGASGGLMSLTPADNKVTVQFRKKPMVSLAAGAVNLIKNVPGRVSITAAIKDGVPIPDVELDLKILDDALQDATGDFDIYVIDGALKIPLASWLDNGKFYLSDGTLTLELESADTGDYTYEIRLTDASSNDLLDGAVSNTLLVGEVDLIINPITLAVETPNDSIAITVDTPVDFEHAKASYTIKDSGSADAKNRFVVEVNLGDIDSDGADDYVEFDTWASGGFYLTSGELKLRVTAKPGTLQGSYLYTVRIEDADGNLLADKFNTITADIVSLAVSNIDLIVGIPSATASIDVQSTGSLTGAALGYTIEDENGFDVKNKFIVEVNLGDIDSDGEDDYADFDTWASGSPALTGGVVRFRVTAKVGVEDESEYDFTVTLKDHGGQMLARGGGTIHARAVVLETPPINLLIGMPDDSTHFTISDTPSDFQDVAVSYTIRDKDGVNAKNKFIIEVNLGDIDSDGEDDYVDFNTWASGGIYLAQEAVVVRVTAKLGTAAAGDYDYTVTLKNKDGYVLARESNIIQVAATDLAVMPVQLIAGIPESVELRVTTPALLFDAAASYTIKDSGGSNAKSKFVLEVNLGDIDSDGEDDYIDFDTWSSSGFNLTTGGIKFRMTAKLGAPADAYDYTISLKDGGGNTIAKESNIITLSTVNLTTAAVALVGGVPEDVSFAVDTPVDFDGAVASYTIKDNGGTGAKNKFIVEVNLGDINADGEDDYVDFDTWASGGFYLTTGGLNLRVTAKSGAPAGTYDYTVTLKDANGNTIAREGSIIALSTVDLTTVPVVLVAGVPGDVQLEVNTPNSFDNAIASYTVKDSGGGNAKNKFIVEVSLGDIDGDGADDYVDFDTWASGGFYLTSSAISLRVTAKLGTLKGSYDYTVTLKDKDGNVLVRGGNTLYVGVVLLDLFPISLFAGMPDDSIQITVSDAPRDFHDAAVSYTIKDSGGDNAKNKFIVEVNLGDIDGDGADDYVDFDTWASGGIYLTQAAIVVRVTAKLGTAAGDYDYTVTLKDKEGHLLARESEIIQVEVTDLTTVPVQLIAGIPKPVELKVTTPAILDNVAASYTIRDSMGANAKNKFVVEVNLGDIDSDGEDDYIDFDAWASGGFRLTSSAISLRVTAKLGALSGDYDYTVTLKDENGNTIAKESNIITLATVNLTTAAVDLVAGVPGDVRLEVDTPTDFKNAVASYTIKDKDGVGAKNKFIVEVNLGDLDSDGEDDYIDFETWIAGGFYLTTGAIDLRVTAKAGTPVGEYDYTVTLKDENGNTVAKEVDVIRVQTVSLATQNAILYPGIPHKHVTLTADTPVGLASTQAIFDIKDSGGAVVTGDFTVEVRMPDGSYETLANWMSGGFYLTDGAIDLRVTALPGTAPGDYTYSIMLRGKEGYNLIKPRVEGVLTIAPLPVVQIVARSGTAVYDGLTKSVSGYTVTNVAALNALGFTVSAITTNPSRVSAGVSANIVSSYAIYYEGDEVTGLYDVKRINLQNGTLNVAQRAATIVVYSYSKLSNAADPVIAGYVTNLASAGDLGTILYRRSNTAIASNAVGSWLLTADYAANPNYTVNIAYGVLMVTAPVAPPPPPPSPPPSPPPGTSTGSDVPTPEEEPPDVTIDEPETPQGPGDGEGQDDENIVDHLPPTASTEGAWALLNLLLTILCGIIMIILLVTYFTRRKDDSGEPVDDKNIKRRGLFRILSIAMLAGSIILFVLTEDIRLPMEYTDGVTIWHALITVIQVGFMVLSRKKYLEPGRAAVRRR